MESCLLFVWNHNAQLNFVSEWFLSTDVSSHATAHHLPRGSSAIETKALDTMGQSEKLQRTNTKPVYIDLIPMQTVTR